MAYAGTTGTVAAQDAAYTASTTAWYAEISDWDFSASESTGGTTGHFTQVVWNSSVQVNCGYATFTDDYNSYYVVCQYYPAGNYQGQYAANVAPLEGDESAACASFNSATVLGLLTAALMRLIA